LELNFDWKKLSVIGGITLKSIYFQLHEESIKADAGWFHFTGITPALSDSAAALCMEAAQAAKKAGVMVSCALNFRKNSGPRRKPTT